MIILEKPYVSEFLIDTIVQNGWEVLENDILDEANFEEGAIVRLSEDKAKDYYSNIMFPKIYSNSENSIDWILQNLPNSNVSKYIKIFKDKTTFRTMLQDMYPDFYYREVEYEQLSKIKLEELRFPFVLKPSVGFLSFGVHTITNDTEWKNTLAALKDEIESISGLYPEKVVNTSKFIMEQYIDGEEFAVDAYFDSEGAPVILNIYQHPFLNSKDVIYRIYLMSVGIMVKYMARFAILLKQIGDRNNIRNFPLHMEVRISNEDDSIIPVEINPGRFAGWCTADVAQYAWGINVYEYFINNQRPDWNSILDNAKRGVYYFSMAEVPPVSDRSKIKSFDYNGYLKNFSNVLELRRINYHDNPLFAVIFGFSDDKDEIMSILELNTKDYTSFH